MNINKDTLERLLSPKEVADVLGLQKISIYNLINTGQLHPVHKLGHKTLRIPESAVRNYLENCKIKTS